jgi:hypothetical protein
MRRRCGRHALVPDLSRTRSPGVGTDRSTGFLSSGASDPRWSKGQLQEPQSTTFTGPPLSAPSTCGTSCGYDEPARRRLERSAPFPRVVAEVLGASIAHAGRPLQPPPQPTCVYCVHEHTPTVAHPQAEAASSRKSASSEHLHARPTGGTTRPSPGARCRDRGKPGVPRRSVGSLQRRGRGRQAAQAA